MTDDRFEMLMVKVTDGFATPTETHELMAFLQDRPDLQVELEAHLALKATTDGWIDRIGVDLALDRWEASPLQRIERGIGLSLVLGGTGLLSGYGLVTFALAPEAALVVKLGVGGIAAGLAVLLLSVVRWRIATAKDDRYTEVIR